MKNLPQTKTNGAILSTQQLNLYASEITPLLNKIGDSFSSKMLIAVGQGMNNPISSFDKTETEIAICAKVMICASIYCGATDTKATPELYSSCARIVYEYYPSLGFDEIQFAFDLAATGRLRLPDGFKMNTFGGVFSIEHLTTILKAYMSKRGIYVIGIRNAKAAQEYRKELLANRTVLSDEERAEMQKSLSDKIASMEASMRERIGREASERAQPMNEDELRDAYKNALGNLENK